MQATLPVLVLRRKLILPLAGNDKEDCGGEWVIVRRHRGSRKKFNKVSFNKPGARSHPGEGSKFFGFLLGRAGPRPQSGASFSDFSTVSVSSPVASSLDGAVGPHAAALFQEECRQDPEFRNRVLGLERMLRVKASFSGSESVDVSKVCGAVPGISVLDDGVDGPCSVPRALPGVEDTFVDGACSAPRALPAVEDTFVYHVHDFDDCFHDADSALGVRDQPARLAAGENEGITELLEVREPDLRMRPVAVVASATVALIRHCACPLIH